MILEEGESRVITRLANKLFREGKPTGRTPDHPDRQNDHSTARVMTLAEMDFDYISYAIKVPPSSLPSTGPVGQLLSTRYEVAKVDSWKVVWTPGQPMHCVGDYKAMVRDLTMLLLSDAFHG